MASITGAKIHEVKVRHHARQFGTSKYGLSRIYRVLFDLLTVKTVVAFAERPLIWFSLLATPFMVLTVLGAAYTMYAALTYNEKISFVPIAITVCFAISATFLVVCGALGELIFRTGTIVPHRLSALTASDDGEAVA